MSTRRELISRGLAGITGLILLPPVNSFATAQNRYTREPEKKLLLRFALASDMHYGEPGTDFESNTGLMMTWLNSDHDKNHFDLVIINGDLVHDRTDLLPVVKRNYLDKLKMPYYTVPGNHDHADAALWNSVFGYADNYSREQGDIGFIMANTADTKGRYRSPDPDFLKTALDRFRDKKIVFVVLHIAPVKWLKEDPSENFPDVVKLLQAYPNVKAAFHGHDHLMDGVRYSENLPHFFDSHVGGSWGTAYHGYRVVEVAEDHTIYTYQVNASQNPVLNGDKLG